ncbi:MAG: autotransporter domain-containing protein [Sphingomonadaceae bacterium]|nr:autotransporter domain-containing protein [Sphingomonadaceae bacterium]
MRTRSYRNQLIAATVLSSAFVATPALADCVSQAPVNPNQVVCDNPGTAGWNGSASNGIVVTVNAGSTTSTNVGGPAVISTGTGSAVINFSGNFDGEVNPTVYGIDAGSATNAAITVGGGTTVTNASGAAIHGTITFGNAAGTATNVLNNSYSSSGGNNIIGLIDGDILAAGNFTFNNSGVVGWDDDAGVTQTGAGTVVIQNGIDGGYADSFSGAFDYQNGFIWNAGGTAISTQGNTTLVNRGGGNTMGGLINGNVILGTNGTGTSSLTNGSQVFGNATIIGDVTMADRNNTVTNDGTITGNVTMNGTGSNTFNAGSLGSSGNNGLRLPGSAIDGTGVPTGTVSGTLTGLAANSANNVLNLNGVDSSQLQAGSNILNFGVVNKNDSGVWRIRNTLDGAPGRLTTVNNNAGVLSLDDASFLGSSATTVNNNANGFGLGGLIFNGTAAGTFAGNIVGTGSVGVTGANATTWTGTNTFTGLTYINTGGVLNANGVGSLSANSDMFMWNGTLNVNANNSVRDLIDYFSPNTSVVNIANGVSLSVAGGSFGNYGGVINGPGDLIKYSTGTLDLDGANQINPGRLIINNGTVNDNNGALDADVAVEVNSTSTTTGVLNVLDDESIASLSGTGANAQVNISSGVTLEVGFTGANSTYAGRIAGAGALEKSGSGTMTLTGSNSYSGGTTVSGGWLVGTTASLQGDIVNNANVVFNQTVGGLGNGTYAGDMSGTGTLAKEGAGTVTLTGTNTYSGSTFLRAGTLAIGAASNIGTGQLQFSGGTLETTAGLTLANSVDLFGAGTVQVSGAGNTTTLTGDIGGTGPLTKTGAGTLILGGTNTYSGGTTVSAGVLEGRVGGGIQGNIVNNATVRLWGSLNTYNDNMSGSGNVVIFDNGGTIMGFMGTNTYAGTTTVDAGAELNSFSAGALSSGSTFVVNGTLTSLMGGTNTIGGLSGSGLVVAASTLNVGANNSSTTFSGTFGPGGFFGSSSVDVNKVGTGTLTLTGAGSVLTGNLGVNAGTLDLDGTLSAATTTVASGATLRVDGTLTSPTATVASGGTLRGGVGTAPGTIVGAVTNNGTVSPGLSPGILAVVGSYTQGSSGTYAAEVLSNGTSTVVAGVDFDRIAVSGVPGTATLAGTLAITKNSNLYVAGTNFDIITTTGGITGSFATVTGTNISAFLNLSNAVANGGGIQGNNYRLVVVRTAYNTAATNPNQVAVANGLTGIIGSAGAAPTILKIDNMTAAQAQALFTTASPEPYGAYATSLLDQGELFTRQVALRLAENGSDDAKTGLWINAYGSWGSGKDRGDYRMGNDHSITGGAIGADLGTDNLRFGVAGGYSEDKVTYLGGNSAGKSKSWQVGGYVGYAADKLHVNAQVAYVSGDITATKVVSGGSGQTLISGIATASTKGDLFKGVLTLGYDMGGEKFTFVPYVGVNFASGQVNGFTEAGMGALNLTVNQINAKRTDLVVGARIAAPMGSISPYLNVAYRYDVNENPGSVSAYFNGVTGGTFTVSTIGSGRSVIDVNAGLSAKIGGSAGVFVGYQGSFRNDLNSHGVNGGIRLSF